MNILGLPDALVQEAGERVGAAIRNPGCVFPMKQITVNLAPAGLKNEGPAHDLLCTNQQRSWSADVDKASWVIYNLVSLGGGVAMPWQLQEAKQKFSQLVQRALDEGPQVVTRHGETVVVVVSADDFLRLTGGKPDFTEFLLSGPDLSVLDLGRAAGLPREVDL